MVKITITAEGPYASGKSVVLNWFKHTIKDSLNLECKMESEHTMSVYVPYFDSSLEIIKKEP